MCQIHMYCRLCFQIFIQSIAWGPVALVKYANRKKNENLWNGGISCRQANSKVNIRFLAWAKVETWQQRRSCVEIIPLREHLEIIVMYASELCKLIVSWEMMVVMFYLSDTWKNWYCIDKTKCYWYLWKVFRKYEGNYVI